MRRRLFAGERTYVCVLRLSFLLFLLLFLDYSSSVVTFPILFSLFWSLLLSASIEYFVLHCFCRHSNGNRVVCTRKDNMKLPRASLSFFYFSSSDKRGRRMKKKKRKKRHFASHDLLLTSKSENVNRMRMCVYISFLLFRAFILIAVLGNVN